MQQQRPTSSAANGSTASCLLLVPRGCAAPPGLLDGLRQRGAKLREVTDGPAVMVELARRRFTAVIVIEPQVVVDIEALTEAVGRYHPKAAMWAYDHRSRPALRPLRSPETPEPAVAVPDEVEMQTPPTVADEPVAEPQIVVRQDAGLANLTPALGSSSQQEADSTEPLADTSPSDEETGPLLTEEELEMLMRDTDWEEAGSE